MVQVGDAVLERALAQVAVVAWCAGTALYAAGDDHGLADVLVELQAAFAGLHLLCGFGQVVLGLLAPRWLLACLCVNRATYSRDSGPFLRASSAAWAYSRASTSFC
jgi:hypothetical protein